MAMTDWMVDPRERRARVTAAAAAIVTSSWLIVMAFRIPSAMAEGGIPVVAVYLLIAASVTYGLARRAAVTRAQERKAKAWSGLSDPWNYCITINFLWAVMARSGSRFWPVYLAIAGASILLALVGRSLDRGR